MFTLAGLPSGTQSVEVRAIGYEPKRVAVDLTRAGLTMVDVVLDHPVQTLDAVKIYGKGNTTMAEFQRRLRAGWGHFLTPADIAKHNAFAVSDLFRSMPGVRVAPSQGFGHTILIRGCRPTVYLNGMRMSDDAASEMPIEGVNAEILTGRIKSYGHKNAEYIGDLGGGAEKLADIVREGDLVITLGAGSVHRAGDQLLGLLRDGHAMASA